MHFYICSLGLVVRTAKRKGDKQLSCDCSTQTPLAFHFYLDVSNFKFWCQNTDKPHIVSSRITFISFIKGSKCSFKSYFLHSDLHFRRGSGEKRGAEENWLTLRIWSSRIYTDHDWPAATSIKASLVLKLLLQKSLQKRSYHILLLTAYL